MSVPAKFIAASWECGGGWETGESERKAFLFRFFVPEIFVHFLSKSIDVFLYLLAVLVILFHPFPHLFLTECFTFFLGHSLRRALRAFHFSCITCSYCVHRSLPNASRCPSISATVGTLMICPAIVAPARGTMKTRQTKVQEKIRTILMIVL